MRCIYSATFKLYWVVHPIHGRRWEKRTFSFFRFKDAQNCRREVRDWCLSQTRTHRQILVIRLPSPVSHKRSVAKTLLQRVESLPSNSDSQANECEYDLNVLGENDYPTRLAFLHAKTLVRHSWWLAVFLKKCYVRSLLRRGLHEVSSEGKVSAQGVMGRAK
jgi:hypothetical protein